MNATQQNQTQSFRDFKTRIGHYSTLQEALAAAMLKGNLVWRIYDETREPYDLVEIYNFAKKYDWEHPITGTQFYWVSRDSAIGISMGLEYRVKWLFVPMEPGIEYDELVEKMGERLVEMEEVKDALTPNAEASVMAPPPILPPETTMPSQPSPQPVPEPVPGMPVVGMPVQGIPVQEIPVQGMPAPQPEPQPIQQPMQGMPVQGMPVQGQPVPQSIPQQPVHQPAPQPQPVQPQPVQPQPLQPQPAAQGGGKSKLPQIIGGVAAVVLITGGYFAYDHFAGGKEAPAQQEEVTAATTEKEKPTTERAAQPSASPASDAKSLTEAALNELKSASTAQQGIDKLNQAIAQGGKESVEALYTLAQLYGRVYSDKNVLANVEKLLSKDAKKAHELNEKAVALDQTYYPSIYELGCDYMAGDARGAVDRDIDKAKQLFTQGAQYAQQANDIQFSERFEIRLSSLE